MIRRIVVICSLLLGCSFAVTLTGCGYSSSVPGYVANVSPTGNIQHIVVIFQENVSFDHYFGTYPNALNLPGETPFTALPGPRLSTACHKIYCCITPTPQIAVMALGQPTRSA